MKNIKLFEEYSEGYDTEREITDSIFEDWKGDQEDGLNSIFEMGLYEDDEDDEVELTSGEKAALARDFQILTKPQLAALYLRALGKAKDNHYGTYTVMIDGIKVFGDIDKDGVFNLSGNAMADAIGLDSAVTVGRTVKKFKNLITGDGATASEVIYPKLIKAFDEFSNKTPGQVAVLASEAIQDPALSTKHRDAEIIAGPRAAAKRYEQKVNQVRLGQKTYSLINSLKAVSIYKNDTAKAERVAIAKIASELDVNPEKVKMAYHTFLRDKGIR